MISDRLSLSFLVPKPVTPTPSPPKLRNPTLEQKISEDGNQKVLRLSSMNLTDADMEIVAYYAIRTNKVRQIAEMYLHSLIVPPRTFSEILNQYP
jgi:radical SAM superfamily enzyme YgiQ (UPF0313 family)